MQQVLFCPSCPLLACKAIVCSATTIGGHKLPSTITIGWVGSAKDWLAATIPFDNLNALGSACGEEDETGDNHLLQCDACRLFVHMDCYGVADCPEGRPWLCDVCSLGAPTLPRRCRLTRMQGACKL